MCSFLIASLQSIKRDSALIVKIKEQIRIKKVKLGIAKNEVEVATHAASSWARKGLDFSQQATRLDARVKVRTSEVEVEISGHQNRAAENRGLIALLKKINAKLLSHGLAEVGSDLSSAAATHSDSEVAALLEAAAEKAKTKGDVDGSFFE
jgi:hypothetical protein